MIAHSPVLPSSPQFPESVLAKDQKGYWQSLVGANDQVWWEQMTFGGRLQQQRMGII